MKAPILAPRPNGRSVTDTATAAVFQHQPEHPPSLTHSDAEWAAAYPEIERLYVRERRKLRHVIQYMEREHNFAATVQMYKKRFAKWGFQKNARRKQAVQSLQNVGQVGRVGRVGRVGHIQKGLDNGYLSIPGLPALGPEDTLTLLLLTSIKTWSGAYFEGVAPSSSSSSSSSSPTSTTSTTTASSSSPAVHRRPAKAKEISFAFKLVMDLLERGRGELAGRTARKAFLLVEDMLQMLQAPVLVWNLLEIMHHIVSLGQIRLFQMLLAHVIALVGNKPELAGGHPLLALLHSLRGVAASAAASSSSSPDGSGDLIRTLLAQAWTLNAEILFAHYDPNLFNLYCCILWESCSIGPPVAMVGSLTHWFRTIDAVQVPDDRPVVSEDVAVPPQQPPLQPPPPPPRSDFSRLHASSVAALRAHGDEIFHDAAAGFRGDTTLLLRMLAGLTTAKILQAVPDTASVKVDAHGSSPPDEKWQLTHTPSIHLGNVACVIRTLMDIDAQKKSSKQTANNLIVDSLRPSAVVDTNDTHAAHMDAVEQIRAVIDLRTQSDGAHDPQVLREMWLLQEALDASGDVAEALKVEQDTYARIEQYVRDIPVDVV